MVHSVNVLARDELFGRILDGKTTSETVSDSCNKQRPLFTTEKRDAFRQRVGFSKTCFKQRSL